MRKFVRLAQRKVRQRIARNVNKLKKKQSNKENSKLKENFNKKIDLQLHYLLCLKQLNVDHVSKQSLLKNVKDFHLMISNANTSPADRVLAMVCSGKGIQDAVTKFKDENPGCDQWLPELLELWDQKNKKARKHSDGTSLKPIETKIVKNLSTNTKSSSSESQNVTRGFTVTPINSTSKSHSDVKVQNKGTSVIKRLDFSNNLAKNIDSISNASKLNENNIDSDDDDEEDDEEDDDSDDNEENDDDDDEEDDYDEGDEEEEEDEEKDEVMNLVDTKNGSVLDIDKETSDSIYYDAKNNIDSSAETLKLDVDEEQIGEEEEITSESEDNENGNQIKTKDPFFLKDNGDEMSGDEAEIVDDDDDEVEEMEDEETSTPSNRGGFSCRGNRGGRGGFGGRGNRGGRGGFGDRGNRGGSFGRGGFSGRGNRGGRGGFGDRGNRGGSFGRGGFGDRGNRRGSFGRGGFGDRGGSFGRGGFGDRGNRGASFGRGGFGDRGRGGGHGRGGFQNQQNGKFFITDRLFSFQSIL